MNSNHNRHKNKLLRYIYVLIALAIITAVTECGCFGTGGSGTSSASATSATAPAHTTAETTAMETDVVESTAETEASSVPAGSWFEVHYIDVGQGDAELVICDGEAMLIDGGKSDKSSLMYTYLKDLGISHLKYIVCTHPDDDHAGGLAGALNYATADHALSDMLSYDGNKAFNNFIKYLGNADLTVPSAGTQFSLGSASCTVIGPVSYSDELNNDSLMIRVVYGSTSFMFTGDAETEEESSVIATGAELKSTVLKVGHHGSSSSTSSAFLNAVSPQFAVISCGAGNSYGHPTDQTLTRLSGAGVTLFRTDLQGDVVCTSNGTEVWFTVEKNADAYTYATYDSLNPTETTTVAATTAASGGDVHTYVVNTNTGKVHTTSCRSVSQMKEKNKLIVTGTREEVLAMDPSYTPCGNCNAMY